MSGPFRRRSAMTPVRGRPRDDERAPQRRTIELADADQFTEVVLAGMGTGLVVIGASDFRIRARDRGINEVLWGLPESTMRGFGLRTLEIGLSIEPVAELAAATPVDELLLDARDRRGIEFRCRVWSFSLADAADDDGQGAVFVTRRDGDGEGVGVDSPCGAVVRWET
jgi:hypothetical protein